MRTPRRPAAVLGAPSTRAAGSTRRTTGSRGGRRRRAIRTSASAPCGRCRRGDPPGHARRRRRRLRARPGARPAAAAQALRMIHDTLIRRTKEPWKSAYYGHATFELADDGTTVLIDPFLTGNPKASAAADDLNPTRSWSPTATSTTYGDTVPIAKRTGATCSRSSSSPTSSPSGRQERPDPNIGGTVTFDWGWVKSCPPGTPRRRPRARSTRPPAWSSTSAARPSTTWATPAVLRPRARRPRGNPSRGADLHRGPLHDGSLRRRRGGRAHRGQAVIPCHYDTFPPIETDAQAFKSDVEGATSSQVVVLEPGEAHTA